MRWLGRLFSSAREPARSTCAARLMAAATDHQRRIEAAEARRDAAYAKQDMRGYGRALMELRQVRHDQLSQEIWG